eukprot:scaffold138476_cov178-Phaeocystis_antarctica.AAC.2
MSARGGAWEASSRMSSQCLIVDVGCRQLGFSKRVTMLRVTGLAARKRAGRSSGARTGVVALELTRARPA